MPRVCTICRHPRRTQIDDAGVSGRGRAFPGLGEMEDVMAVLEGAERAIYTAWRRTLRAGRGRRRGRDPQVVSIEFGLSQNNLRRSA